MSIFYPYLKIQKYAIYSYSRNLDSVDREGFVISFGSWADGPKIELHNFWKFSIQLWFLQKNAANGYFSVI